MINILKCFPFSLKCFQAEKKKCIALSVFVCVVSVTVSIDFYFLLQIHIRRFYLYMINKLRNACWATAEDGINDGSVIDLIWMMLICIGWVCGPCFPSELRIFCTSNTLSPCRLDVSGDSAPVLLTWLLLIFLMIKKTFFEMKNQQMLNSGNILKLF